MRIMFVTVFRQHNWHMGLKINSPLAFRKRISEEINNNNNMMSEVGHVEQVGQETSEFLSETSGYSVQMTEKVPRALTSDSVDAMYLANFLSRPVNIYSLTWAESDSIGTTNQFYPWLNFFNDSRIKEKLQRYSFLQCTLKIKVVINASPFYYGAMLMSYQPQQTLSPSTIGYLSIDGTTCLRSQRPHIWIYPQTNEAGEITLPYINYRNWTRIVQSADFTDLGQITFQNVTQLQSANGTVGTGVTITVFAWAEDVNVSGPTLGSVMAQGSDEYGIISTPSSTIATIASKLISIPMIGPFALATQIGASAISKIAHLFGYTNVPNIKDVDPVNIKPFHNFADTSISFPIDKLTMDSKNELSISQQIGGIPDIDDPLAIESLCNRQSFLATVPWATSDPADQPLFYMNVGPNQCNTYTINANDTAIYPTPMSYVASQFIHWRGDIVVSVRVIASKFHKGRFRLIYDPYGDNTTNVTNTANAYSGCVNTIVDVTENVSIDFVIPYSQANYFQLCPSFGVPEHQITNAPSFTRDITKHNGVFMIRSVTQLTAPQASSTVQLLVSVRGRNMEFANPGAYVFSSRQYSFKAAQAGFEYDNVSSEVTAASTGSNDPNMFCTVFGERIFSIRQLIKRMNYLNAVNSGLATGNASYQTTNMGRLPPAFGYDNNGGESAVGLVTPGNNYSFNFAILNPLTWFTPCFVGQRGSINYAISSASTDGIQRAEIYVQRDPINTSTTNSSTQTAITTTSGSKFSKDNGAYYCKSSSGCAITTGYTNHGFEFQMPMYSKNKFQSTKVDQGSLRTSLDESDRDSFTLVIKSKGTQYQSQYNIYVGAGTDFNLIFFLNCPVVHLYNAVPTAN